MPCVLLPAVAGLASYSTEWKAAMLDPPAAPREE